MGYNGTDYSYSGQSGHIDRILLFCIQRKIVLPLRTSKKHGGETEV